MSADDAATQLEYARVRELPPRNLWRVPAVAGMCMLAAWFFGASNNAINSKVNLQYFQQLVGWIYAKPMTTATVVVQGLFESTFFGLALAVTMSTVYLGSTRARCPLKIPLMIILVGLASTIVAWLLCGTVGFVWATINPNSFAAAFPVTQQFVGNYQRWVWCGSSIVGAYAGGIGLVIIGPIVLHLSWRRHCRRLT